MIVLYRSNFRRFTLLKNRYVCAAIILLMIPALVSCRAADNPTGDSTAPTPSPIPVQTATPKTQNPPGEAHDPEFSLRTDDITLTLRETFPDQRIEEIPLPLISDNTETLGEGSDTFAGSYIRTISYEGLELVLFAPSDNKKAFWLMAMTTNTPGIKTSRGVQVGDTLALLQEKYPEAESSLNKSGDDMFWYSSEYSELAFDVSEDMVTRITLTFYLP